MQNPIAAKMGPQSKSAHGSRERGESNNARKKIVKEANGTAGAIMLQKVKNKKEGALAPPASKFYSSIPDDEDEMKATSSVNNGMENTNPDHPTDGDFVVPNGMLAESLDEDASGSELLQVPLGHQ